MIVAGEDANVPDGLDDLVIAFDLDKESFLSRWGDTQVKMFLL